MKRLTVILITLLAFTASCKKEEPALIDSLLIGQWNGYEVGDENGFSPGIYSLTNLYEHGIRFFPDKSFSPRYNLRLFNLELPVDSWEERSVEGQYTIINNQTIRLSFHHSDINMDLHVVRLDDKELWFKRDFLRERWNII